MKKGDLKSLQPGVWSTIHNCVEDKATL
jgi:hypothetical protein